MNIQGLIERYEKFKASKKKLTSVDLVLKDLRSLDEPEPLPFKLKDVVRRIRGFDPTTQTRWLNDILRVDGQISNPHQIPIVELTSNLRKFFFCKISY